MEEKKYKVLSIGAHQDDADTSAGGLLKKLADKGWDVRLLSTAAEARSARSWLDPALRRSEKKKRRQAARCSADATTAGTWRTPG